MIYYINGAAVHTVTGVTGNFHIMATSFTAGSTIDSIVVETIGHRELSSYEGAGAITRLDSSTGRILDSSGIPPVVAFNLSYKFNGDITYSATSSGTATISVAAGDLLAFDPPVSLAAMSASVSGGTAGETDIYYLYIEMDDPDDLDGPYTLQVTTDPDEPYSDGNYGLLGTVPVEYPTSGSSTGDGGSAGGGGVTPPPTWTGGGLTP